MTDTATPTPPTPTPSAPPSTPSPSPKVTPPPVAAQKPTLPVTGGAPQTAEHLMTAAGAGFGGAKKPNTQSCTWIFKTFAQARDFANYCRQAGADTAFDEADLEVTFSAKKAADLVSSGEYRQAELNNPHSTAFHVKDSPEVVERRRKAAAAATAAPATPAKAAKTPDPAAGKPSEG